MPHFSLAVVSTSDGFIARAPDHPPQDWASAEEQALFFDHVNAADWAIMGRNTHEAADKADRRRIILTSGTPGWRRPTQLWLDPRDMRPGDLGPLVGHVHQLDHGLILGGTTVHDWFLRHNAIDTVYLTIEPVAFGTGLPIFSDHRGAPDAVFLRAGFDLLSERVLNAAGTRYLTLRPRS